MLSEPDRVRLQRMLDAARVAVRTSLPDLIQRLERALSRRMDG